MLSPSRQAARLRIVQNAARLNRLLARVNGELRRELTVLRGELGDEHDLWSQNASVLSVVLSELHALDADYVVFANGSHGHLRVRRMLAALARIAKEDGK